MVVRKGKENNGFGEAQLSDLIECVTLLSSIGNPSRCRAPNLLPISRKTSSYIEESNDGEATNSSAWLCSKLQTDSQTNDRTKTGR